MLETSTVEDLLRIGTTAISPYNTQPWRFRVTGDSIEIYIVRTKNFFLKLQGISHMTLGCLLENLSEGARHLGFEAEALFLGGTLGLDQPCARLLLRPLVSGVGEGVAHVLERTTNRKVYRPTPLDETIRELVRSLAADDNMTVFISEGRDQQQLAHILAELESVRLSNYKMTREALEYIRHSEQEMQAKPEGLDLRTLELGKRIVPLLKPLERRRVHGVLKLAGITRAATRRHRDLLLGSGAILTYAIRDRSPQAFVQVGRAIQRTLNALTAVGVQSMSVLSGLYLLDVLQSNPEIFSRRETHTLMRARVELERFFGVPDRSIVFIVRIGHADPPKVRQSRRRVEELFLPE